MAKQNCFTKIAVSLALAASAVMVSPQVSAAQTVAAAPAVKSKAKATSTPTRAKSNVPKKRAYSAANARARRAQLARARAEARARELRELQTPRFTVDEFGREVPDVRAEAAVIYDPESGRSEERRVGKEGRSRWWTGQSRTTTRGSTREK